MRKIKKKNQRNQVPTAILEIAITLPEPDKTEQQVLFEKTTPTKVSEITPYETNETERKHDATSQEDIVLMEMNDSLEKQKIPKQSEK